MRGARTNTTVIAEIANVEKLKLFFIHCTRAHAQYYLLFYRQPVSQCTHTRRTHSRYVSALNRRHVGTWTNLLFRSVCLLVRIYQRINFKRNIPVLESNLLRLNSTAPSLYRAMVMWCLCLYLTKLSKPFHLMTHRKQCNESFGSIFG